MTLTPHSAETAAGQSVPTASLLPATSSISATNISPTDDLQCSRTIKQSPEDADDGYAMKRCRTPCEEPTEDVETTGIVVGSGEGYFGYEECEGGDIVPTTPLDYSRAHEIQLPVSEAQSATDERERIEGLDFCDDLHQNPDLVHYDGKEVNVDLEVFAEEAETILSDDVIDGAIIPSGKTCTDASAAQRLNHGMKIRTIAPSPLRCDLSQYQYPPVATPPVAPLFWARIQAYLFSIFSDLIVHSMLEDHGSECSLARKRTLKAIRAHRLFEMDAPVVLHGTPCRSTDETCGTLHLRHLDKYSYRFELAGHPNLTRAVCGREHFCGASPSAMLISTTSNALSPHGCVVHILLTLEALALSEDDGFSLEEVQMAAVGLLSVRSDPRAMQYLDDHRKLLHEVLEEQPALRSWTTVDLVWQMVAGMEGMRRAGKEAAAFALDMGRERASRRLRRFSSVSVQ
ncbi:uncharacterized protein BXZ73DRAFT_100081 [Epithele typhae]|uniref:uncharacterized protein n=1 Tax=Epithele typhae TaxID=378194 RepID=UPI0020080464|nr:uncharacterized protein BXZ73DRAFT_100081 [Epithele typhae]KAH9937869.1 hypothetical protein BXZ73DRAFT_100081 [Epithele typhae]